MGRKVNMASAPVVISATIGTDLQMEPEERRSHLLKHARALAERREKLAQTLLERLLIDGTRAEIQLDDIERLVSLEKMPDGRDPSFVRDIVVELLVCLRTKP